MLFRSRRDARGEVDYAAVGIDLQVAGSAANVDDADAVGAELVGDDSAYDVDRSSASKRLEKTAAGEIDHAVVGRIEVTNTAAADVDHAVVSRIDVANGAAADVDLAAVVCFQNVLICPGANLNGRAGSIRFGGVVCGAIIANNVVRCACGGADGRVAGKESVGLRVGDVSGAERGKRRQSDDAA